MKDYHANRKHWMGEQAFIREALEDCARALRCLVDPYTTAPRLGCSCSSCAAGEKARIALTTQIQQPPSQPSSEGSMRGGEGKKEKL